MYLSQNTFRRATRTLVLASFLAAAFSVTASAQQTAAVSTTPSLDFSTPLVQQPSEFSSSSAENVAVVADNHFDFLNAQPARRGYGRPRYRGANTNADGSNKYSFFAGAGLSAPLGNTKHYDTLSYAYQVGAGRNFNRHVGINVEFDWDNFGLQGSVLTQQALIEDPDGEIPLEGNTDGYSHVWSFSLDPIYNLTDRGGLGAYVTGGVGFYHKITTFTTPEVGQYCYYYCEEYVANEPFDSYTSNAPGVNGGLGLTYKFSRFSNERLYVEARYVVTFNQQRQGINGSNYNNYAGSDYNYPTTNLYPANSNRSTYIPVKFGIRF